jgi:hypothetical protein
MTHCIIVHIYNTVRHECQRVVKKCVTCAPVTVQSRFQEHIPVKWWV